MKITIVSKKRYPELLKLRKSFDVVSNGDIFIAIGGDGTFIRTAEKTDKPVLLIRDGDNGSTGYHSDVTLKDINLIIKQLKSSQYHVENVANKIELVYKDVHHFAINEVRLNNIREEVSFNIYEIEGNERIRIYPFIMSGDGLLVTGKVGSTAYNLSAGGPIILTPDVLCMTFLNVDGPYRNPIVMDAEKELEVEIVKYTGTLICDERTIGTLQPGARFRIRLSSKKINIVRFRGRKVRFSERLERKIRSRLVKDYKKQ